ncbi:type IX secretion system membrane protein PorP/SprF [Mucilaginibacter sp. dw_454]|uniref:PorP/SprF family type IX secretion system membrane protein n=1 Tax=Mucilaginibacter sp. dw_454 TaxID=2720079 RepID=UPI001BD6DB72|nr:type IX secretion system membrane protein PorP/SprF [Mucilaginibacter sp. dw_454]
MLQPHHISEIKMIISPVKIFKWPGRLICLITVIILGAKQANAQSADFQSVYFQNQYLANPAMAGIDKGLKLNAGYQQQWTTIPGNPVLQNLTAEYNAGNRVGVGLMIDNNSAGLISRTRAMATYAYHLPLNEDDQKLNFGVSLGFKDNHVDYNKIVADPGDQSAQSFNQRGAYVDGDLGLAYTSNSFNVQAAVPNLKSLFFPNQTDNLDINRSTFYTAVSYKIDNGQSTSIEPKIAFRGAKGLGNIVDAGANVAVDENHFDISGIYHSDKSATLLLGLNLNAVGIMISYTNNTGPLRTYANNTFELDLRYVLFN